MSTSLTPKILYDDPLKQARYDELMDGYIKKSIYVKKNGYLIKYLDNQLHPNREFWGKCQTITAIAVFSLLMISAITIVILIQTRIIFIPPGLII
jgi:hypothetical protein